MWVSMRSTGAAPPCASGRARKATTSAWSSPTLDGGAGQRMRRFVAFRILVDDHFGIGEGGVELGLDFVGDLVRADQRHPRIELEVELDEGEEAGAPGPEIVHGARRRMG